MLFTCSIQCQCGHHAERHASSTSPRALPLPHRVMECPSCSELLTLPTHPHSELLTLLALSLALHGATAIASGAPRRCHCSPNSGLPCVPQRAPPPSQRRAPPCARARLSRLSLECPHHLTVRLQVVGARGMPPRGASGRAEWSHGCTWVPRCSSTPQPPPAWPPPAGAASSR
jgi:hypothetical protein